MRELSTRRTPQRASDAVLHDEAALVVAAKRDPHAFAPLYRHYVDHVYAYCRQRLGTCEAAEDATSRTFEQALRRLHSCREETFRGWLFTIAAHVISDDYRTNAPPRSLVSLDAVLESPDVGLPVEDAAIADDAADHLQHLLQHLPADQRRVLELRAAGLKGAEIATVLGRSHAAIRMLQLRAVRHLRERLHPDERQRIIP